MGGALTADGGAGRSAQAARTSRCTSAGQWPAACGRDPPTTRGSSCGGHTTSPPSGSRLHASSKPCFVPTTRRVFCGFGPRRCKPCNAPSHAPPVYTKCRQLSPWPRSLRRRVAWCRGAIHWRFLVRCDAGPASVLGMPRCGVPSLVHCRVALTSAPRSAAVRCVPLPRRRPCRCGALTRSDALHETPATWPVSCSGRHRARPRSNWASWRLLIATCPRPQDPHRGHLSPHFPRARVSSGTRAQSKFVVPSAGDPPTLARRPRRAWRPRPRPDASAAAAPGLRQRGGADAARGSCEGDC